MHGIVAMCQLNVTGFINLWFPLKQTTKPESSQEIWTGTQKRKYNTTLVWICPQSTTCEIKLDEIMCKKLSGWGISCCHRKRKKSFFSCISVFNSRHFAAPPDKGKCWFISIPVSPPPCVLLLLLFHHCTRNTPGNITVVVHITAEAAIVWVLKCLTILRLLFLKRFHFMLLGLFEAIIRYLALFLAKLLPAY